MLIYRKFILCFRSHNELKCVVFVVVFGETFFVVRASNFIFILSIILSILFLFLPKVKYVLNIRALGFKKSKQLNK